MPKLLFLCAVMVCLALPAAAQDFAPAFDLNTAADLSTTADAQSQNTPTLSPIGRDPWQIAASFQYQDFRNVYGVKFHTLGYNSDLIRYIANWFGLEGTAQFGFGHTNTTPQIPRSLDAKSFFVGGGPHISLYNGTRFEPWAHTLVGLEHYRFTETNQHLGLGSNSALAFMAGGGLDYKIVEGASWRVQADFIGSHFGLNVQKNFSVGTGFVFTF